MTNLGGRPRAQVDDTAILDAYQAGQSISQIARTHQVDRCVIGRVIDEAGIPRRDDRGAHWATKRGQAAAS